ncbi:iron-sulfur cluster assembly scaffold protein [Chloroflexota bacterium]
MTTDNDPALNEMRARMAGIYSETVIEHTLHPHNWGELPGASGFARLNIDGGESISFYIRVRDGNVTEARFTTDGCAATIACASMATDLVTGRSVSQAWALDPEEIISTLGGLPKGNHHNAALAVDAVRAALRDYQTSEREPWKRTYRS